MNLPAIVCDAQNLSQIAIIQELGKRNIPIIAISDSDDAIGNYSKYIYKKYCWSIPSYTEEYISRMITVLERGVIFYSNDPNVENISEHSQKLISNGFKVIVADRCTLNNVINKENLYVTAQECSVKVPKTLVINSYDDLLSKSLEIEYPFILKANNFAGGIYSLVSNKSELHNCYKLMRQRVDDKINLTTRQTSLLIQEWIPQDNLELWNLSAFVLNGEIRSYSMGRRIRTNLRNDGTIGSTLLHGVTEYNKKIFENNSRLFKHINYDGLVETEWSLSSETNELYLYDFNPRPSGNIRWALNSGLDIEQYYLIAVNGNQNTYNNVNIDLDKKNIVKSIDDNILMKSNVKYYKILYEVNDSIVTSSNAKLTNMNKISIFAENINAIINYKDNVIDILDIHDLKPTFIACKRLPILFIKCIVKLVAMSLVKFCKILFTH